MRICGQCLSSSFVILVFLCFFVLKWCGTVLFVQTAKRSFSCPAAGGLSCPAGRETRRVGAGPLFRPRACSQGRKGDSAPIAARRFPATPAFVVARSATPLCELCVLCGFALNPAPHPSRTWRTSREESSPARSATPRENFPAPKKTFDSPSPDSLQYLRCNWTQSRVRLGFSARRSRPGPWPGRFR